MNRLRFRPFVRSFLLAGWMLPVQAVAARASLDGLLWLVGMCPPEKVILDTGRASGSDDAGALSVRRWLADLVVCEIFGVISSPRHNRSNAAVESSTPIAAVRRFPWAACVVRSGVQFA
ncbi:MAG: hypothetical protein ACI4QD_08070 [Kiritimatiellia bacterium]